MQNALGLFSFPDLDLLVFLIRLNSVREQVNILSSVSYSLTVASVLKYFWS